MKRLKLKKKARNILLISIVLILFLSIGLHSAIKIHKQKEYEKTYEYKLTNVGYSLDDTKILLDKLKDKEIDYLLKNDKSDLYLNIIKEKYFIYDNFYKYIEYYNKNKDKDLRSIVEIINTNRNKEYYTETYDTDISKGYLLITNKYYHLNETYTPNNLVAFSTTYAWGDKGSKQVTQDTYDAYMNMWKASHENGYYLMVSSAYRDYNKQVSVYDEYKTKSGEKYADSIAARPGFSEHQTGYALDIFEKGYTQKTFETSDSYKWLQDNAHKFGFIERYPKDKENITGFTYESWHYRYIGVEAATYIHDNHITFDEYYEYFVK